MHPYRLRNSRNLISRSYPRRMREKPRYRMFRGANGAPRQSYGISHAARREKISPEVATVTSGNDETPACGVDTIWLHFRRVPATNVHPFKSTFTAPRDGAWDPSRWRTSFKFAGKAAGRAQTTPRGYRMYLRRNEILVGALVRSRSPVALSRPAVNRPGCRRRGRQ